MPSVCPWERDLCVEVDPAGRGRASVISAHHQMLFSRLIWLRKEWHRSFLQDNTAPRRRDKTRQEDKATWQTAKPGNRQNISKNNDETLLGCRRNWGKVQHFSKEKNTAHRQQWLQHESHHPGFGIFLYFLSVPAEIIFLSGTPNFSLHSSEKDIWGWLEMLNCPSVCVNGACPDVDPRPPMTPMTLISSKQQLAENDGYKFWH